MNYKGMMFSDVPNLASAFGYTNASWTLKCDLTCDYVCRLLNHMERTATGNARRAAAMPADGRAVPRFLFGLCAARLDRLPKQGAKAPWKLHQNYALDIMSLKFSALRDGAMEFTAPEKTARAPETLAN